jgi:hypothetical protein
MISFVLAAAQIVVMHFHVDAYGIAGTGTIAVDCATGQFVRKFDVGPASEQEGFDGTNAWRADATGMPRVQGNVGERGEILAWSRALVQAMKSRLTTVRMAGSTDHVVVSFSDYRQEGSLSIPGRIAMRSEENGDWSAQLESVETPPELPASAFAPPAPVTSDAHLSGLTSIGLSKLSHEPMLDVQVNGVAMHFIFDTGGQNVISKHAAKRAGLQVVGHGSVGGGGGTTQIAYAWAQSVQVGDATLDHQPFIVLEDQALPEADGIVGYELLSRFAARLDMAHAELELAPTAAAFGDGTGMVPFAFDDRHIQVQGSLDDIPGPMIVDTGSTLSAAVPAPFVQSHNLIASLHANVWAYAAGVGGRYRIRLARAHAIQLGAAIFEDPIVDLLPDEGTIVDTTAAATVGDGILRRWIIVFDYPDQRVDFRPGGDASGSVIRDHSGIVLDTTDRKLIVGTVLGGTPAARAGVTNGAQIVKVDGETVSASDLTKVRDLLRAAPGTPVQLTLADGSTHRFTLEQYL